MPLSPDSDFPGIRAAHGGHTPFVALVPENTGGNEGPFQPGPPGTPLPPDITKQVTSPTVTPSGPSLADLLALDQPTGGSLTQKPILVQQTGTNWTLIVIVLVLGIGGYLWWKSRKSHANQSSNE